jgi:hypothetical protein
MLLLRSRGLVTNQRVNDTFIDRQVLSPTFGFQWSNKHLKVLLCSFLMSAVVSNIRFGSEPPSVSARYRIHTISCITS